ncbi:MAG: 25S rRNA (uracil2634-N3)-methyltransferase [Moritella sp.]|jgi:25S rRNA (uracil2634-N3)-methyltransferase
MFINPKWRILTVGDGDLSFSLALLHHYQPQQLTATIFDDYPTLAAKYGAAHHQQLQAKHCTVLTEFDIIQPNSWSSVNKHSFDLVIFQFPLVPGFTSQAEFNDKCAGISVNVLNRRLLRRFLINACAQLLDPHGPQLCYITSKDVKPYSEWNMEHSLNIGTDIHYQGSMPFDITQFPGYRIRNVDRDKHVKDTQGTTYVWSPKSVSALDNQFDQELANRLRQSRTLSRNRGEDCCRFCHAGPFTSEQHKQAHFRARKHLRMSQFEQQWLNYLQQHKEEY